MMKRYLVLGCVVLCGSIAVASEKPGQNNALRQSGTLNRSTEKLKAKDLQETVAPVIVYYDWPYDGGNVHYSRNYDVRNAMKPYLPFHRDCP